MSLNVTKLINKKRKALPVDADYIEELERILKVTDEAYENLKD